MRGWVQVIPVAELSRSGLAYAGLEEPNLSSPMFSNAVSGMAFLTDNCTLISASASGEINAWELCSGRQAGYDVLGVSPPGFGQAEIAQNRQRAAARLLSGAVRIWELGGEQAVLDWIDLPVTLPVSATLSFSPDSSWLAAWETESFRYLGLWYLGSEPSDDAVRSLQAWLVGEGKPELPVPQQVLPGADSHQASLTALQVAAPSPEPSDISEVLSQAPLPVPDIPGEAWSIHSSTDGQRLVAFYDLFDLGLGIPEDIPPQRLFLLDRSQPGATWQEISSLETTGFLGGLVLSPSGRWLVATGSQEIRLVDLSQAGEPDRKVQLTRSGASVRLDFSASERWLAIEDWGINRAGDSQLWLVDLAQPDSELTAVLLSLQPEVIGGQSFSGDDFLVLGAGYNQLRMYDLTNAAHGERPSSFEIPIPYMNSVGDLGISHDSRWLVGSSGSALWFFPLELDELIARACQAAGRNLSEQEVKVYLPGEDYQGTCPLP